MVNLSFKGKRFKIVNKFFIFLAVSLAVILVGVGFLIGKGMNVGIDFAGGATIEVTIKEFKDAGDFADTYVDWLKGDRDLDGNVDAGAREFSVSASPRISTTSEATTYEFRLGTTMKQNGETVDLTEKITDEESPDKGKTKLLAYTQETKNEMVKSIYEFLRTNAHYKSVYGEMSDEELAQIVEVNPHTIDNSIMLYTIRTAFIAAAVAIVVMLVYIMIRFTWISGIAAVLALLHDVLIMVACTIIFQIPVNSVFIAAVITIIGYSINATIVVFEKVRKLLSTPSYNETSDADIANEAVTNTLTRSILTTFTTLVVIVLLAIFAPASIKEFAYPIIFGLIAGAYSSILLSAPIWVYLRKLFKQSGRRPKKKSKKNNAAATPAENA